MKKLKTTACITAFFMLINLSASANFFAVSEYNWYTPSEEAAEAVGHLNFYNLFKNDAQYKGTRAGAYEHAIGFKLDMGRDMAVDIILKLCEYNLGQELPASQNCTFAPIFQYLPLSHLRLPRQFASTFEQSIKKAYEFGLINGVSISDFGNHEITNQELAVILYRTAKALDCYKSESKSDLSLMKNFDNISYWALEGVSYMFTNGVVQADFNPTAFSSKEETCMIIHRFALAHNLYTQLASETIDTVEYIATLPTVGSWDGLYAILNENEKQVMQKAIELFPDAYQTIIFVGEHSKLEDAYINSFIVGHDDKENKEYATVALYSPNGDFELKFTERGICFNMNVDIDDYDVYKDLILSIMNLSPNKHLYADKLDKIQQEAYSSTEDIAWFDLYAVNGDIVPNGLQSVLGVSYNRLYNAMRISIDDLYMG